MYINSQLIVAELRATLCHVATLRFGLERRSDDKVHEVNSNFGANDLLPHHSRRTERLVDGDDYFDMLADDVIVEYVISVPAIQSELREEARHQPLQRLRQLYVGAERRQSEVYHDPKLQWPFWNMRSMAISSGGRPYDNRFVSIVTIENGKVTKWRDYLDPIAVFDALGWPS